MRIRITCLVVFLFAILFAQIGFADTASTDKRTFQFPEDVSIGAVYLIPLNDRDAKLQATSAKGQVTLVVPPRHWLAFVGGPILCRKPNLLEGRNFKGIDYLKLNYHSFEDDGKSLTDPVLRHLKSFEDIQVLNVRHSDATDAGLSNVKGLSKLTQIDAFQCALRGQCLAAFESVPLENLDISSNIVSAQELKGLSKLKKLKYLNIAAMNPSIDAQGLQEIAKCQHLIYLYLTGDKRVDDASVGCLSCLSQLKRLGLTDTSVTVSGFRKLKGLKLEHLGINSSIKNDQGELATLKTLFPKCRFLSSSAPTISTDDRHLFAPMQH